MSDVRSYRTVLVCGSPRSGTTWVQVPLAHDRAIVTTPETHIFPFCVNRLRRQSREEHEDAASGGRGRTGLSQRLSYDEFLDLCRLNARALLDETAARRTDAHIVLEKSPAHARHAASIHRLFPNAYVLHGLREPRDTVAPILAAGRSRGRNWAPRSADDAARGRARHVHRARTLQTRTPRYREVCYGRLRADATGERSAMLEWLDAPLDRATCEAIGSSPRPRRSMHTAEAAYRAGSVCSLHPDRPAAVRPQHGRQTVRRSSPNRRMTCRSSTG